MGNFIFLLSTQSFAKRRTDDLILSGRSLKKMSKRTGVTVYLDPLGSLTPGGQATPGYLDPHPGYLDPHHFFLY